MTIAPLVIAAAMLGAPQDVEPEREAFVRQLEERVRKHRYFKTIAWERADAAAPLVLLVQEHPLDQPNYAESLIGFYGQWLVELADVFDEQLAQPVGLERIEGHGFDAACILLSEGDHRNYLKAAPHAALRLRYDAQLRMTVGYNDLGGSGAPFARRVRLLGPHVTGLLQAYYSGEGALPSSWWLRTGITGYLVTHVGREPDCLRRRLLDPKMLEPVVAALHDPAQRATYVLPLTEQLELADSSLAWARVGTLARENGVVAGAGSYWEITEVLPVLWVYYLAEAEGGARRASFLELFRRALGGEPVGTALAEAFPGTDAVELERDFLRWVFAEHRRRNTIIDPVDETTIDAHLAGVSSTAAPAVDPAHAAPDRTDPRVRHALALQAALAGEVQGAVAELEELAAEATGDRGRPAVDLERLRVLGRVRDEYLQHVATSGGKLKLTRDGKRVSVPIERIDGGVVYFGKNRAGLESLATSALPTHDLATEMTAFLKGRPDAWVRHYVYVLAGDERWRRLLKSDTEEQRALRSDAEDWYPALLRLGRVATALVTLAEAGRPADAGQAEAALTVIRDLLASEGELDVVQAGRPGLEAIAAAALELRYDDEARSASLAGEFELTEDGVAHLVYELESEEEWRDFVPRSDYLSGVRAELLDVGYTVDDSTFVLERGSYSGTGATCLRHPLQFEESISMRAVIEFAGVADGLNPITYFWMGICDDGDGSYANVDYGGGLSVVDRGTRYFVTYSAPDDVVFMPFTGLEVEIRLENGEFVSFVDGEEVKRGPAGPLTGGASYLFLHTNTPVEIHRIELRGRLRHGELERLQREWISEQLTVLGF